jgi:drug/metabolite transporter (DMT)-like permease
LTDSSKALLQLVAANVCWSTGGLLIKMLPMSGLALAGYRSLLALMLLLILIKDKRIRINKWLVAGSLSFALNTVFFVLATQLTTAANAILLQYTAPIYVILLSGHLLGERSSIRDILSIGLAICGLLLLFADNISSGGLVGNLFALAAGISFAGTILMLRKEGGRDPLAVVLGGNFLAALFLSPFMINNPPAISDLPILFVLGFFQFGLGYYFYAAALRYVSAVKGVLAAALEPVLNPIWVFLFIGEFPGVLGIIGGVIIISAVVLRGVKFGKVQAG